MKKLIVIFCIVFIIVAFYIYLNTTSSTNPVKKTLQTIIPTIQPNPLSIQYMRNQTYPGSQIKIERTLPDGTNYHQYIASYQSQGLKIYALLAIPIGTPPKNGWPIIIFNHGY